MDPEDKIRLSIKEPDHKFKFKCKSCRLCCSNNEIFLYPMDIYNLCRKLEISTKEFIDSYSSLAFDKFGILRCKLLTQPYCVLNEKDMCKVYDSRPIVCRAFPVGRIVVEEDGKNITKLTLPQSKCEGFSSGKKYTIQEWLDESGVTQNDKLRDRWVELIEKLKKSKFDIEEKVFAMMFKKAFYDFDNQVIELFEKDAKINANTMEKKMDVLFMFFEAFLKQYEQIKKGYKEFEEKNGK